MAPVIVFVIVMTLELFGFEVSGGMWYCTTMYLVVSELERRFNNKGEGKR